MTRRLCDVHSQTPTLHVSDPRGLVIREVAYCRVKATQTADERIHCHRFNPAGRLASSSDPRLAVFNLTRVYSLSGTPVLTDSVDAGWRLELPGQSAEVLSHWDGRATEVHTAFDACLRPVAITEQAVITQRLTYGEAGLPDNQSGRLIQHDHPSGTQLFTDYGLLGLPQVETHIFLNEWCNPPSLDGNTERDQPLAPEHFTHRSVFNTLGEVTANVDARSNTCQFQHTVAGERKAVTLTLAHQAPTVLVSDIHYNASGQIISETAGNGRVSLSTWDPRSGYLIQRAVANLQKLNYQYDPVGNILSIEDTEQPLKHFRNQRTEPINRYAYDSLYQLIQATGREVASTQAGPQLPTFQTLPMDPSLWSNYTRQYDYDAAGNLLTMQHLGAHPYRQRMAVSRHSNKSVPVIDDQCPSEDALTASFDANGNLKQLQPGQAMRWNRRNQLEHVDHVVREETANDSETYGYNGVGQRVCKVRINQTHRVTHRVLTLYLPGLEIHRNNITGEVFHVIRVNAGHNTLSVLHWEGKAPKGAPHDSIRYSVSDHLGSCTLELNSSGSVLSHEGYYPFGGTAWWAGRNAVHASCKTLRYSGKERDATGLYYYGFRYYAPWLHRWINPDPAGTTDGLNLFLMVQNNPVKFIDINGLNKYEGKHDTIEIAVKLGRGNIKSRGLSQIKSHDPAAGMRLESALDYAKSATNEAVRILESEDLSPKQEGLATRIFGASAKEDSFRSALLARVKTLNNAVDDYVAHKTEQIVEVKSKREKELAFTLGKDSKERIFFTTTGLQESPRVIAMTLVHELSHLKLDTEDFHYYEKGHQVNPEEPGAHMTEADRVAKGAEDQRLADYSEKQVPKDKRLKIFGAHKAPQIIETMKVKPATRSQALLNNADSISLYIFGLAYALIWRKDMGFSM